MSGAFSVPEPDVAVVPGRESDYVSAHPTRALLVVEVADSSLVQDRLTKAAVYATAGVPEYWIVNLQDDWVEVLREPVAESGRYGDSAIVRRGGRLGLVAAPGAVAAVDNLLPPQR